jgi:hypothetical protein
MPIAFSSRFEKSVIAAPALGAVSAEQFDVLDVRLSVRQRTELCLVCVYALHGLHLEE